MGFEEAIGFALDQIDSTWSGWAAYSAVALGVLGVVGATVKSQYSTAELRVGLTIGFIVFGVSNAIGLANVFGDTAAFLDVARSVMPDDPDGTLQAMVDQLQPFPLGLLWAYHLALDAAVVAAIWLLPRASARAEPTRK